MGRGALQWLHTEAPLGTGRPQEEQGCAETNLALGGSTSTTRTSGGTRPHNRPHRKPLYPFFFEKYHPAPAAARRSRITNLPIKGL